jgi:hypothetical protein
MYWEPEEPLGACDRLLCNPEDYPRYSMVFTSCGMVSLLDFYNGMVLVFDCDTIPRYHTTVWYPGRAVWYGDFP